MHKVFAIIGLVCALPLFVSAQAGFPDKPLWVSNGKPLAGEEVSLSTVLYNGTGAAIGGTLTFFADNAQLSSQEVSLAAQSSNVFSATWKAVSGTHSFSAKFATASGTASTLQQQTSAVQITVTEPPPPPSPSALQQSVGQATAVAGQLASSSAPFVQKVAQAVFTQTEALRNAGIEYLEEKVAQPQESSVATTDTNTTGFVLGTSTKNSDVSSSLLHTIGQTAASAALFALRSFYIYYPILAFIVLFSLYWAARKLRRPHSYN